MSWLNYVLYYYSDWSYVPRYNNADDSEEYKTANGFSYHQGPVSKQLSYCMSKYGKGYYSSEGLGFRVLLGLELAYWT